MAQFSMARIFKCVRWLVFLAGALWSAHTAWAAVTISYFAAQSSPGQIKLMWTTASELKNRGFNVERSTDQKTWQHLGNNPSVLSQSPCVKNLMGAAYQFVDPTVAQGQTYYYRLQMVGQPCGDPNTYYEQIVAAVSGPTPTPTAPATAPGAATRTPTLPAITAPPSTPAPTMAPRDTPSSVTVAATRAATPPTNSSPLPPTKLARASMPATQVARAPEIVVPSQPASVPTAELNIESTRGEEPVSAVLPETPSDSGRGIIFAGALGLAGLFGLGALGFGALAGVLFTRSHWR